MSAVNFSHVALNCRNMAAVEAFYATHFGFRRARLIDLGEGGQILFLKSGSVYLELFQAAEAESAELPQNDGPSTPGVRHLAFQVADIDEKLAEIGEAAEVTLGPLAFDDFIPGWRTVWVRDPEGMIVEISQGFVDQVDVPPMSAGAMPAALASASNT